MVVEQLGYGWKMDMVNYQLWPAKEEAAGSWYEQVYRACVESKDGSSRHSGQTLESTFTRFEVISHKEQQGGRWDGGPIEQLEDIQADRACICVSSQTIRKGPHPRLHPGQAQPEAYNVSRPD